MHSWYNSDKYAVWVTTSCMYVTLICMCPIKPPSSHPCPTYHQKLLHSVSLMILAVREEDGSCQGIDCDCQAVNVVLVTFERREERGVWFEGKLGESHTHKDEEQAPYAVVVATLGTTGRWGRGEGGRGRGGERGVFREGFHCAVVCI